MNCEDFGELLEDGVDAGRQARMLEHAAGCPACRRRLEFESLLQRQLRALPVPAASPDFEQRVLANAHRASTSSVGWRRQIPWALAASLVLAIGIWFAFDRSATPVVAVASTAQAQPVRLVFRSPVALSGVTIELALPDGVELAGYPGQRSLSWQADLQSGANLLELPVLVRGDGGVLTATLNLGAEKRRFSVEVRAVVPHA
jgi:hypothetical protein